MRGKEKKTIIKGIYRLEMDSFWWWLERLSCVGMVIRKNGKLSQKEAPRASLTDSGLLFPAFSLTPLHLTPNVLKLELWGWRKALEGEEVDMKPRIPAPSLCHKPAPNTWTATDGWLSFSSRCGTTCLPHPDWMLLGIHRVYKETDELLGGRNTPCG